MGVPLTSHGFMVFLEHHHIMYFHAKRKHWSIHLFNTSSTTTTTTHIAMMAYGDPNRSWYNNSTLICLYFFGWFWLATKSKAQVFPELQNIDFIDYIFIYNYIIIHNIYIYEDGPRAGTPLCFNKGNTRNMKQLLLRTMSPVFAWTCTETWHPADHCWSSHWNGWIGRRKAREPAFAAWYTSRWLDFLRNHVIIWIIIHPILGLCCSMMLVALLPARVSTVFGEHGPRYMLCSLAYRRNCVKSSNTLPMPLVDVMPST